MKIMNVNETVSQLLSKRSLVSTKQILSPTSISASCLRLQSPLIGMMQLVPWMKKELLAQGTRTPRSQSLGWAVMKVVRNMEMGRRQHLEDKEKTKWCELGEVMEGSEDDPTSQIRQGLAEPVRRWQRHPSTHPWGSYRPLMSLCPLY